jgi:hypothetical protein
VDARSRLREFRRDRRTPLLLFLLLLLVVIGAGIGTLSTDDAPSPTTDPTVPTITATPVSPTPSDPTPTPATGTLTAAPPSAATPTATPPSTDGPSPPGAPAAESGGGGGDDESETPASGGSGVALEIVGDSGFVSLANAKPGDAGRERVVLRNVGDRPARVVVPGLAVTDDENGYLEPERSADDSPGRGDLSAHVFVTLAVVGDDGRRVALYGTGDGPRSMAALAAESDSAEGQTLDPGADVQIVLDWSIPSATGNEIQSDRVTVEIPLELRTLGS